MITLDTILPKLKRNERIVSHYENERNYVRFTIEFSRMRYKKNVFDVYVSLDNNRLSIRYYFNDADSWAYEMLEDFLLRLKESVKRHEDIRLRAVTGAVKIHVKGIIDEEYYEDAEHVDVHEMASFFLTLLLGVASIFECLSFFDWMLEGFILGTTVAFGYYFYASMSVWLEDKKAPKDKTAWIFIGLGFLMVLGLTLLTALGLVLTVAVAWILPWMVTIPGFVLCYFAYHYVVKFVKKVSDMNEKYSAGA